MIDPGTLLLWLFIGTVVGCVSGHFIAGYGASDDIVSGAFGSLIGGVVGQTLFRDSLGGPWGMTAFSAALAVALILAVRVLPGNRTVP